MRVLVTAGATREPIDAVRFISNASTGATGAALARALGRHGHGVTLLNEFTSAADLRRRLEQSLATGDIDAVIMAAAVSDYRPETAFAEKLSSSSGRLVLNLVRNEKILPQLRSMSPTPLKVVGFKLTVGADVDARLRAVADQFATGNVDAVVQNDLHEIRDAALHPFRLFRAPGRDVPVISGTDALADGLTAVLALSSPPPPAEPVSRSGLPPAPAQQQQQ